MQCIAICLLGKCSDVRLVFLFVAIPSARSIARPVGLSVCLPSGLPFVWRCSYALSKGIINAPNQPNTKPI